VCQCNMRYARTVATGHSILFTDQPVGISASSTPVPMASAYGQDSASAQGTLDLEMDVNTEGKPVTIRTYRFGYSAESLLY